MPSQNISHEFMVQCVLQHTEQGVVDWLINNSDIGGFYADIDDWTVTFKGDGNYGHFTYQKGLKFGEIIVPPQKGFFKKDDTPMRIILRSLLIQIRKRVYPENKETVAVFEEQEQKIRREFCASMLGWNK